MGHCNSKQLQLPSSHLVAIESSKSPSSSSSSRHRNSSLERVVVEINRSDTGSTNHKPTKRFITYEEDSSQSSKRSNQTDETANSSSTNSTSPGQGTGTASLDRQLLFHRNTSSRSKSQSPPQPHLHNRSSHRPHQQQQPQQSTLPTFAQKYHILPQLKLGHGIAGEVHQCIHRSSSRLCAVKTMTKSKIRRKDRIEREISFLRQLRHPNIINMYDAFEDEFEVHIVTEICRGGELFDMIVEKAKFGKKRNETAGKDSGGDNQSQPRAVPLHTRPACFSEQDAARIIRSLLSAVSYLHSNDIIHRDIKPENILFTEKVDREKSPIKLIDLGLSIRHARNCPPLSNIVGTSYYMAPELLGGSYDRSCDLWSVGVIAYVLLSGRPPFNGSNEDVIFNKIRRGQFRMNSSLWDGIGEYAKDFIRCLLDMDPRRRWTADMALKHAWLKPDMLDSD
eukprot:CAMPEP_0181125046 /NCGR_PEP_ID=MMETSP1071-20121207/26828_1 /TAXON_ID=35127 /ORGANISM="Thalassiosira sp., Strain NH16" /LENGTH=450 /DNA_ID=CAMNT_0023210437 /DNA_START=30 /DNA_END=1382 /DNA_ORIENTATION=-